MRLCAEETRATTCCTSLDEGTTGSCQVILRAAAATTEADLALQRYRASRQAPVPNRRSPKEFNGKGTIMRKRTLVVAALITATCACGGLLPENPPDAGRQDAGAGGGGKCSECDAENRCGEGFVCKPFDFPEAKSNPDGGGTTLMPASSPTLCAYEGRSTGCCRRVTRNTHDYVEQCHFEYP